MGCLPEIMPNFDCFDGDKKRLEFENKFRKLFQNCLELSLSPENVYVKNEFVLGDYKGLNPSKIIGFDFNEFYIKAPHFKKEVLHKPCKYGYLILYDYKVTHTIEIGEKLTDLYSFDGVEDALKSYFKSHMKT